ncbi:hypothetical protein N7I30_13705 [Aurantimonas litoralis]|nr:hypothetical protein [Aurantimonas litoralis]
MSDLSKPRNAEIDTALNWLDAALKCEGFLWDVDQREAATMDLAAAREAASRLQAPAVVEIGMAEIETVARSDAKCDGRDFDGLGRADKERYRSRAWAGLRALRTGGSE